MLHLRVILAAIFAILIANPACCCAGMVKMEKPAAHSCCGGTKKEKRQTVCDCSTKDPRIAEPTAVAPDAPIFIAAVLPKLTLLPELQACDQIATAPPEPIGGGPPRSRLLLWQRFQI